MFKRKIQTIRGKALVLLSFLLISMAYSSAMLLTVSFSDNAKEIDDNTNLLGNEPINSPRSNAISLDSWWNASFLYRRLLNITNPYTEDLIDFTTSITFDYSEFVSNGHMNSSLYDLRIVENGILRDYYYEIDYPNPNYATLWFKTNCSASSTEYDTFLYYGNNSVSRATGYYMAQNPDGLMWYSFDNDDPGLMIDKLNNYNATAYNSPSHSTGKVGTYSLSFNGNNQYLGIQGKNYNTVGAIGQLTVCLWFQTSFIGSSYNDNWAFFDFDRSEYFNFYIRGDNGQLGFSSARSGIDDFYSNTGGLNDGDWHFGVAVYDGTNKYIYIDPSSGQWDARDLNSHSGLAIGTGAYTRYGIIGDGSEATSVGTPRNNIYYQGLMDEIRYFERAISNKEIEWLYKGYELQTVLNEEQEQLAQVILTCYDVDNRIVPNAKLILINATDGSIVAIQSSSTDGTVEFNQLEYGTYNITVNYTLNIGTEEIVYDSSQSKYGGPVQFMLTGLYHTFDIILDLWTIDFEIVDWDNHPMNQGFISISEISSSPVIETLTLNSEGTATFRWHNRSSYYYKVYYQNEDYNPALTPLNESYIFRSEYTLNQKYYTSSFNVNETSIGPVGFFEVNERLYTAGSKDEISGKKILQANITLSNMVDHLDSVKVYFINRENKTFTSISGDHLIYQNTYGIGDTDAVIYLDMRHPQTISNPLINENYEVYGLYIEVDGTNSSQCNGVITIDTLETLYIFNRTELSKISIQVVDEPPTRVPVPGVVVHVFEGSISDSNSVVNLTTDQNGMAYGLQNSDIEFWYKRGVTYNFTLEFFGVKNKDFTVNYTSPSQWMPLYPNSVTEYNYTLYSESSIIFELIIDSSDFVTEFLESYGDTSANWGEDITYSVNFTYSTDGGISWFPINTADEVKLTVKDFDGISVFSIPLDSLGNGNFSKTFDSGVLSAGFESSIYTIEITGKKAGYGNPEKVVIVLQLYSIPTGSSIHDYDDMPQAISRVSQYYNELVNITTSYYPLSDPGTLLHGAVLSYSWDYSSGFNIGEDPINPGYYTFEIDTSLTPTTGIYSIDISIELENYSRSNFAVLLEINPRHTTLNGTSNLYHVPVDVWVKDSVNFTFEYTDITGTSDTRIGGAELAYYYWYQLAEDGSPLGTPSSDIDLIQTTDNLYIIDFDTANRGVGKYALFVTIQKDNYEVRNAFVNLEINYRTIGHSLSAEGLQGSQITVIQGENIMVILDLIDESRNLSPLTGATITLVIGEDEYWFSEEGNGRYQLIFPTDDINAFFMPQFIQTTIEVTKEDYITKSINLTFVVGMPEIFGFPMFYFLMIVIGIAAVAVSLLTYRQIQRARIPKFVKKVRDMSKSIKGRKSISDSLLYPTKEEYIIKKLGDKWDMLGLSLDEIYGVDKKKRKKLPETPESEGGAM